MTDSTVVVWFCFDMDENCICLIDDMIFVFSTQVFSLEVIIVSLVLLRYFLRGMDIYDHESDNLSYVASQSSTLQSISRIIIAFFRPPADIVGVVIYSLGCTVDTECMCQMVGDTWLDLWAYCLPPIECYERYIAVVNTHGKSIPSSPPCLSDTRKINILHRLSISSIPQTDDASHQTVKSCAQTTFRARLHA